MTASDSGGGHVPPLLASSNGEGPMVATMAGACDYATTLLTCGCLPPLTAAAAALTLV